jgi:polysaccharide export outer membrane protein
MLLVLPGGAGSAAEPHSPLPAVSSSAVAPTSPTRPDYQIGVGDLIRIQVHDEDDLTVQTRLDSKGTITYPFLGELRVAGSTVRELEGQIADGLKSKDYLLAPEVQVVVIEYRPFYVTGEVTKPGGYPYIPDLTVQKAVSLAGGFTQYASERTMYLIREKSPDRRREKAHLDTEVLPGDTLIIGEGLF